MSPPAPLITASLVQGPVAIETLSWPEGAGAECVFVGRTRAETHPEFGRLVRLRYEAYEPMAQRVLRTIAEEEAARSGCLAVRAAHAQGDVGLGEASVVIQVAAAHRGEAFDACRRVIDRVKVEAPVWKREVWERGETFVEGRLVTKGEA